MHQFLPMVALLGMSIVVPVSQEHGPAADRVLQSPSTTGEPQVDSRRRSAAEQLVRVMKVDGNAEQIVQAMLKAQKTMIASQNLTAEQQKRVLDRIRVFSDEILRPLMARMAADSIDAYAATFTLEELEGLTAFYESPLGQKLLEKQPQLMSAMMQQATAQAQKLMPELLRKIQEETRTEIERIQKGQ